MEHERHSRILTLPHASEFPLSFPEVALHCRLRFSVHAQWYVYDHLRKRAAMHKHSFRFRFRKVIALKEAPTRSQSSQLVRCQINVVKNLH